MPFQSVRFRSDGTTEGTEVTTDSGEVIKNVTEASLRISMGDVGRITLEISLPMVDANGLLEEIAFDCPVCTKRMHHRCHNPGDDDVS